MKDVEIFSIGDELLRGLVQDSNSHWMAKRITARGANLRRVAVLPDEPPVVAEELRRALGRAAALILTQGGLGPTDDDRTREALALATDRPLEPHDAAEQIVRRRYVELAESGAVADAELSEARARMTRLPRGAEALDNEVGAAPAVLLDVGRTTIVSLPGVPPELIWIWENPLQPVLDRLLGPGGFAETTVILELLDESHIAQALRALQARHPEVYVKSRAKGFGEGDEVRVTLTASGPDDAGARALVEGAFAELRRDLTGLGVRMRED